MTVRVTAKQEFPEKLFYEKVLSDWRDSIEDRNRRHVILKALQGLKMYPAAVKGYTDLRKITGIGENIATRLDAAWKCFTNQIPEPRIRDIREIKKGNALPNDCEDLQNTSMSQPAALPSYVAERPISGLKNNSKMNPEKSNPVYLTYDPVDYGNSELILIVDGRELGLKRKNNTVADHLEKLEVKFETRPLSVGDYLWIIKFKNGEELILDYVIERKTWDDLKASIRQARYHEQKQRLKKSGIRNIIVIAEGGDAVDRSLEQALVSTSVECKFFIQRTQNLFGTAKFLASVTKRLKSRILTEQFVGLSFGSLQSEFRKTKSITVSDLFLRQLTVCPLISVDKAKIIVERFPTWKSLVDFYRCNKKLPIHEMKDPELLIHETIPQINKAMSRQLAQFFDS